ncbi:4Fe-4S dicluster domain-containing protein [Erwinia sp. E_sp_B04_7]|uniref:4Fe-4S dicluster domain-containing protein n=1 Tax=unclassified Erwinia TaxID=2622719 RepID=UPI0030D57ED1
MSNMIVASAEKCIGCHTCEVACAVIHAGTIAVGAEHYFPRLKVVKQGAVSVPVMCRQCENAPCVAACPVAALQKGEHSVEMIPLRCIDCKSCMVACPFGAIEIVSQSDEARHSIPLIRKCDLCAGHEEGPVCIAVCPTDALLLLTPGDLSLQQQKRQQQVAIESLAGGQLLHKEWING